MIEMLNTLDIPIDSELAEECRVLWEQAFSVSYERFIPLLGGAECAVNANRLFLVRVNGRLAGTTLLTICKDNPRLGGVGEVVVHPDFRRRGIAEMLCGMARNAFQMQEGRALFLATSNPIALRLYHRLGWRNLAGSRVMALVFGSESPESFLVDYFREVRPVTIAEGSAADRIPMIPLLVTPHDWHVLDANTGIFSTRLLTQTSCMGLYPRYACLREDGRGTWFSARDDRHRLLGLSTIRLDDDNYALIDAFTHALYASCWDELVQAAIRWASEHGAGRCTARISVIDAEKRSRFEHLGFRDADEDGEFDFYGGPVGAIRLEFSM